MTIMSEGLLLNSNYIKMGRKKRGGGGGGGSTQPPVVIVCHVVNGYSFTALRP